MLQLYRNHHRAELDLQIDYQPMFKAKLEQLVALSRESMLQRLNKTHEREVGELKKKLEGQNWDEMKELAKKHKDKSELAR